MPESNWRGGKQERLRLYGECVRNGNKWSEKNMSG
jgi:hypothetical protein